MASDTFILLNIQPRFAESILNGTKKWEYRKMAPKINEETKMLLYASGDVRAVVGECLVTEVIRLPLDELIERTIYESNSTKEGLLSYFSNATIGSALHLKDPKTYKDPINLSEIVKLVSDFIPPQNFYYLRSEDKRFSKLYRLIESKTKMKSRC